MGRLFFVQNFMSVAIFDSSGSKKSSDDAFSNPLESKKSSDDGFPTPWKAKILGRYTFQPLGK